MLSVCSLVYLFTLEAYTANNMDPEQTAPFGIGYFNKRYSGNRHHEQFLDFVISTKDFPGMGDVIKRYFLNGFGSQNTFLE